ncbi:MAG: SufS family cysteine desulfurase [Alphaproteobacteria bacterium]|nr:SufS family cysteine desulfurase [Alphaproteobacteria bacterium]
MNNFRKDFPIFKQNPKIVYLDSGASAQKPACVLESMTNFYENTYANIHRGLYAFSEKSTELYDEVRGKVAKFIGAKSLAEIVFTRGTTDAINLVANSYGNLLKKGDEIIVSIAEHHSNLLPWKNLEKTVGVKVKYLPILDDGEFDYVWLEKNISGKVKLVCVTGQSNVLGLKTDIEKVVKISHSVGAKVLIDGAQLTVHSRVDVSSFDIDFYVFSGHKIYGPTGIGILYGKKELLDMMPPYQFGGDMVESVSLDSVVFKPVPSKFEAGTPPIAEVVGLGSAIDFLQSIGMEKIENDSFILTQYLQSKLLKIDGVKILSSKKSNSIVSFVVDGISPFDIGIMLGQKGICVRVGKHCAEPLHRYLGVDSSIRVSLGLYNDESDIDKFIDALQKVLSLLR